MLREIFPEESEIERPLFIKLRHTARIVVEHLALAKDYSQGPTTELITTVDQAESMMERIYNYFNMVDLELFQVLAVIPLTVLPSLMLATMLISSFGGGRGRFTRWWVCCTSWFLLPIFTIVVIFSCLLGAIFSGAAIVNSDFCYGGVERTPTATLSLIMEYKELHINYPMAYESARFVMDVSAVPGLFVVSVGCSCYLFA